VAHAQKKSGSVTMWNNPPKVWTTHFKINAQQYKAILKIGYYIYAQFPVAVILEKTWTLHLLVKSGD
jgi:hypothetical protein